MHARLEASAPTSEACPNDSLYEVRSTKVGKLQLPLQYTNREKNLIGHDDHFDEILFHLYDCFLLQFYNSKVILGTLWLFSLFLYVVSMLKERKFKKYQFSISNLHYSMLKAKQN